MERSYARDKAENAKSTPEYLKNIFESTSTDVKKVKKEVVDEEPTERRIDHGRLRLERNKKRAVHLKRGKKGQPLMANMIHGLLAKIEKDK